MYRREADAAITATRFRSRRYAATAPAIINVAVPKNAPHNAATRGCMRTTIALRCGRRNGGFRWGMPYTFRDVRRLQLHVRSVVPLGGAVHPHAPRQHVRRG